MSSSDDQPYPNFAKFVFQVGTLLVAAVIPMEQQEDGWVHYAYEVDKEGFQLKTFLVLERWFDAKLPSGAGFFRDEVCYFTDKGLLTFSARGVPPLSIDRPSHVSALDVGTIFQTFPSGKS